jgi:putative ABC transport system permease protein
MFNNLIKHSLRAFRRQRSYIIINITGLSIGIACSLLIALYVYYEESYDRFNVKKDRIFDIALNFTVGSQELSTSARTSYPVGVTLLREFPEVEDFLRMRRLAEATTVTYNEKTYSEENILVADSSFFNFFTIPVLKGDPGTLLNAPQKVVLSVSLSKKIFGNENPLDKILKIGKDTATYIVTGVMGDIPGNSHFKAGMLVSMLSDSQAASQQWGSNNVTTYLLLRPNANYRSVDEKFPALIAKYFGPEVKRFLNISFEEFLSRGNKYEYSLQKLTDIHLNTSIKPFFLAPGDPKLLKILGSIALLILLVAVVNFINLSTAQASSRVKEVAIKKLSGSTKTMLIAQFLTESVIMSFVSTIVGLIIIKLVLPFFNDLLGTTLTLSLSDAWFMIPFMILFALGTGIIAGSYPAFFLSAFSPYRMLKGGKIDRTHRGSLRKVLVVLQFTISILLIVGTLIMYRQIVYMLERDPGFIKDQLLVIENEGALGTSAKSFKEAISMIPGVVSVTSSSSVPGISDSNNGYMVEGKKDETIMIWTNNVDYKFLETYGMQLKSGRFFKQEFPSDAQACVLNEAAIKKWNIDPEKLRIMGYRDSGKVVYFPIIGVVKDFVFDSQRKQIAPLIFRLKSESDRYGYITVKISPKNYGETIKKIETAWHGFVTEDPLTYKFVDDIMKQLYIKERQNAVIAVISSFLAIFIAILGLYGLTSYTVEQRTKEIGVRKAMGSTVHGIYFAISREIIILISVSAVFSFPIIYYLSGKWLESFYYRISPGLFSFLAGLIIVLGITVLTISYRTLRAARVNPSQSLRYE